MIRDFRDAAAIVLAGGAGRRMGGEKALLRGAGTTLVERHLTALAPHFGELVVSVRHGGPSRELAEALERSERDLRRELVVAEDEEEGRGPLAGLGEGLGRARSDRAFVIAVDVPEVDLGLVARLFERLRRPNCRAVVPRSAHGPEPAYAVYRRLIHAEISDLLECGRGALRGVVDLAGVAIVDVRASEDRLFSSLNTQDDYARWLHDQTTRAVERGER